MVEIHTITFSLLSRYSPGRNSLYALNVRAARSQNPQKRGTGPTVFLLLQFDVGLLDDLVPSGQLAFDEWP